METKQAEMMARDLMQWHGLFDRDNAWHFKFDNAVTRLGLTSYKSYTISLSRPNVERMTPEQVLNTILHEIAHVLVGGQQGHNATWTFKAVSIGCDGKRCSHVSDPIAGKWALKCKGCAREVVQYHRRPKERKVLNSWHKICGQEKGRLEVVVKG